jgi:glycerate dehydrogenase
MQAVLLDAGSLNPETLDMSPFANLPIRLTSFDSTADHEVISRVSDAEIILVNKVNLSAEVLAHAPKCRYIGVLATGTNNVDKDYCASKNITVANVAGYGTASVVQHTMMLLLNLVTSFVPTQQQVKQGQWSRSPHFCLLDNPVTELADKHLVIVGYGELGQGFANIAKAFGMRVSVAARPGTEHPQRRPLDDVLPEADVVSLHCMLSEQTQHLMNAARFKLMKPSAFLINTARGGLIDDEALLDALQTNEIAGAGLDSLAVEPPPADHILLTANLPNLLITPHSAWSAKESRQRLVALAASHLKAFLTDN